MALSSAMDERLCRQWAAAEAVAIGWGGASAVSSATGLSRNTIAVGRRELELRQRNRAAPVEACVRRL